MLAGLAASVGSAGDTYDDALAETTIGLYKTDCAGDGSPFRNGPIRTLAGLEEIPRAWVHWYNAYQPMPGSAASRRLRPRPRTARPQTPLPHHSGTPPGTAARTEPGVHETREAPDHQIFDW